MTRIYQNFVGGELDADMTDVATTFSSPALASMQAVTAPDTMIVVVNPDGLGGTAPEAMIVTAHTAAATTATVTRGALGTTAVAHVSGDAWVHPLVEDDISFVGAFAYTSSTQSIASGTTTALAFDTEEFDSDSIHDNSTNNSRLTIPSNLGGYWHVGATAQFALLNDGTTSNLRLSKNGSDLRGTTAQVTGAASAYPGMSISRPVALVAGDYVEARVTHFHGSNRDVQAGAILWAYKIG